MITPIRKVIYISIEYCESDLFSGNGVCARSQVRGLAAIGIEVFVICGRPKGSVNTESFIKNITVKSIPLSTWYTTDINCAHQTFARETAAVLDQLEWDMFDVCFAVDWTGMNMYSYLNETTREVLKTSSVPLIYLNFRAYSSMSDISDHDRAFYRKVESAAVNNAILNCGGVVSLSTVDQQTLQRMAHSENCFSTNSFRVVLPMLRDEFQTIAVNDKGHILDTDRCRIYLISMVRLSEDKGPHRFVKLLEALQRDDPDVWLRTGVVPLLCGAESQPEYASKLKARLAERVPDCVIMDKFLNPAELALTLQNSILNIHPALYEAYGLTIIEAAAMGCPSIVHESGIGATQLLPPSEGASEALNLENESVFVERVKHILYDTNYRKSIAKEAYLRAVGWTEAEHVQAILDFVQDVISWREVGCT